MTGSSRGIGRAIADELAAAGAAVVVTSRSAEDAEQAAESLRESGAEASAFACDVSQAEQARGLVEHTLKTHERVDILVNNAGVIHDNLVLRLTQEEWETVIDTNLNGTFYCIKAVARPMLRQRSGRIINITSIVGLTGNSGQANYAASKAGVIGLTKACAREFASRNITVNAVAPGFIDTTIVEPITEEARAAFVERIPLGRVGTPKDVAVLVAFLASEQAGYITGQVINSDGGLAM